METIVRRAFGLIMVLGLALGIVAMSPADAAAKPIRPGGDSVQMACKSIHDQVADLVAEFGKPSTTNARRKEILNELQNLGSQWNAAGCRARYGDIVVTLAEPAGSPYYTIPVQIDISNWEMKGLDAGY